MALGLAGLIIGVMLAFVVGDASESFGWLCAGVGMLFGLWLSQRLQLKALLARVAQLEGQQRDPAVQTGLALQSETTATAKSAAESMITTSDLWLGEPAEAMRPVKTQTTGTSKSPDKTEWPDSIVTIDKLASDEQPKDISIGVSLELPAALQWLIDFCRRTNPFVLAGLAILFFGLSFLATYFAHQGLLSMPVRLTAIGAVGAVLLAVGVRRRQSQAADGSLTKHADAPLLQGGGIAVMYLTLFAACKYYPLIDGRIAFGFMLLLVLGAALLALWQSAQSLAVLATVGGFLVPILTADGSNQYVGLFSYYLLLNLGIAFVSMHQQWRLLNWTGFVATFVISLGWQIAQYDSSHYLSVQPFFAAYFLLYLFIGYWFSRSQPPMLRGWVDGSLVFGLPLVSFSQQILLTRHLPDGDSLSAAAYAAVYVLLYLMVRALNQPALRRFGQIQLLLAVMFASLVLPFAFGAKWTALGWAIEAAGIYWLGLLQQSRFSRLGAAALLVGALMAFTECLPLQAGSRWFIDGDFINALVLSLSLLAMALCAERYASRLSLPAELWLSRGCFVLGFSIWHSAFAVEFYHQLGVAHQTMILFSVLSMGACLWLSQRLSSRLLWQWGYALLPLLLMLFGLDAAEQWLQGLWVSLINPLTVTSILLLIPLHYGWLWIKPRELQAELLEQAVPASQKVAPFYLAALPWLLQGLLLWQLAYAQQQWQWADDVLLVGFAVCLSCPLWLLLKLSAKRSSSAASQSRLLSKDLGKGLGKWPRGSAFIACVQPAWFPVWLIAPMQFGLLLLAALCLVTPALSLSYPLLNWPDLVLLWSVGCFVIGSLHWQGATRPDDLSSVLRLTALPRRGWLFVGVIALVVLTAFLSRATALTLQVPWQFAALWQSSEVHMVLSLGWAMTALCLMWQGHNKALRLCWQAGATLLAIVLGKLFLVDLADSGSLYRIVSFIGVGALTVWIGIKAPLPSLAVKPQS